MLYIKKFKYFVSVIILALLFLWGNNVFADGKSITIKYSFRVNNENNIPVENALVFFDTDSAVTDKNGIVNFSKIVTDVENSSPVSVGMGIKIFSSAGDVVFDISGANDKISIEIFNILGQKVIELNSGVNEQSSSRLIWSKPFRNLSNGVYPFRVTSSFYNYTGAAVLQDGILGIKKPNSTTTLSLASGKKKNVVLQNYIFKAINPGYDTLAGTVSKSQKDTVILISLKRNKYSENLVYDPRLELKVEHNNNPDQTQFLFWDKTCIGAGRIKKLTDAVKINGFTGEPVNICTNYNGAGTKITSAIWFWNSPQLLPTDCLNFGVYTKSTSYNSAHLSVTFIDRDLNPIGPEIPTSSNSKINEYELLKIENIPIPVWKDGDKMEGVFGVRFELSVDENGAIADFIFPMANIGKNLENFASIDIAKKFSEYKGLETFVQKILSKNDVTMVYMGDSITHRYDDSQTGLDSSYATLFTKWITTKFRVKVDKRNNGGDGSWDQSAIAVYQKMGLAHSPDFILFANCRNQSNFRYPGAMDQRYAMAESMIRRGKIQNSKTDMLIWVPMYELQDSKRDTAAYTYDQEHIRQNNLLVEHYGITTAWPHEKMKNLSERGLVSWYNWFGSNNSVVNDRIHQTQIGCYLFCDELKHVIAGSMLGSIKNVPLPEAHLSPLTKDLMSVTTFYPNDFGVKPNSVKSGKWVQDENMTNSGNLAGVPGKEYGVELGEYDQPIRTTSIDDYIEVKWTGKHFGVWFMDITGRGDAEVIVDGVSKVFKHTESKMINTVCFPRVFTFGVGWQSLGFSLGYGEHVLRIKQKNAGALNTISVAMVTVF